MAQTHVKTLSKKTRTHKLPKFHRQCPTPNTSMLAAHISKHQKKPITLVMEPTEKHNVNQRLGESYRQTEKSCSVFRVVRDASSVRSCGREMCLRCMECVWDPCPAAPATAAAPALRCPVGVPFILLMFSMCERLQSRYQCFFCVFPLFHMTVKGG